jgi:hypothetical protein
VLTIKLLKLLRSYDAGAVDQRVLHAFVLKTIQEATSEEITDFLTDLEEYLNLLKELHDAVENVDDCCYESGSFQSDGLQDVINRVNQHVEKHEDPQE